MSAVLDQPVRRPALFASAHQALLFAYTFSANQYAVTAAAERSIAMFARERYGSLPMASTSRGLSGLDGAAQAGMIKAKVCALADDLQCVIEARFAVLSQDLQRRRMVQLGLAMREHLPDRNLVLAVQLVQRHYGCGEQLMTLAMKHNLAERTIKRRWQTVRKALQQLDQQAMAQVEIRLEQSGVVEPIDA